MRGKGDERRPMFFAIDIEDRIRPDHPLRPIKAAVDAILVEMSPLFDAAYAKRGRPSVPPEVLLRALLLQCLYTVRSEKQLVERIDTDLLFRWFCGLDPAEPVFDATAFTHNRPRLDTHGITAAFFDAVVKRAVDAGLTSDEHFSVDGTLIESYASIKSFRPTAASGSDQDEPGQGVSSKGGDASGAGANAFKPRNPAVDFHGQKRSNATHRSTTDPEARLYRKGNGQAAKLAHMGHTICENRHGLIVATHVSEASGTAECSATLTMLGELRERRRIRPKTLGADKGYDSGPWMLELEQRGVTPHAAMRDGPVGGKGRRAKKDLPLIEARQRMADRMSDLGYELSQRARKKIEEGFGWCKTIGGLARTRLVGRWKITQQLELTAAAYNLVRMRKLLAG
jgi:transposase